MTKTALRAGVTCAAITLLLTACGNAPDESESTESGDLPFKVDIADDIDKGAHFNWGFVQYATSWDPTKSVGGGDMSFYIPVYDRLFLLEPDATLEPMLATGFEEGDDGNTVTLTLREGLVFSDGTPFDAEAVKFNLERTAAEGSSIRGEVAQFQSAEVIDEHTIKVTVSYGLGAYLNALTARAGIMVSPQAAQSGVLEQEPVGIGPYITTSLAPGDRAEYALTENYWDPDAQNVATMTYRFMADDQTRLNALQSGEIDGAILNPGQIDSAVGMGLQVVSRQSPTFLYLMVNSSREPFDDPKVREALNYAIDRVAIAEGLYDGHCTPSIQPWPETSPGYNDEIGDGLDIFPHDPEKAKQLLQEAGVPEGIEVTSVATNVTQYVQLAEAYQSQLKEVGINMSVKPVPTPQIIQEFVVDKTIDINVNPYTGIADPHGVFARTYLPGAIYDVGLPMPQETLDKAMAAAGPIDPAERKELYKDVMQDMVDTPPHMIPVCLSHSASAYRTNVSNVEHLPSGIATNRGVAISSE